MTILVDKVEFSYDNVNPVIKGISTILGSENTAIIGQNGAGKTTFIRLLNNTFQLSKGVITIDGESVDSRPLSGWAQKIGYVFQNPKDQLFQESVYKEIEFGLATIHDEKVRKEKVEEIAELVGLESFLRIHPMEMAYSRQKLITLASVLTNDPELILLDEPTAGQDWREIEQFATVLRHLSDQGKIFLTISHDMDFVAQNFQRVLVLYNGTLLIDGSAAEVFSQPELIRRSFVEPPVPLMVSRDLGISGTPLTIEAFCAAYEKEML